MASSSSASHPIRKRSTRRCVCGLESVWVINSVQYVYMLRGISTFSFLFSPPLISFLVQQTPYLLQVADASTRQQQLALKNKKGEKWTGRRDEREKETKEEQQRKIWEKETPLCASVWCSGWVSLFRSSIGNNPISTKKSNTSFERKKIFTAQTYVQTVKTPAVMTKMKHLIGAPVVTSILSPLPTSKRVEKWKASDINERMISVVAPLLKVTNYSDWNTRQQEKVEKTKLDKYKIGL